MQVFGKISAWEVRSFAGPVVEVSVPAGGRLVREGQLIGTFFVIRAGRAELIAGEQKVGELEIGDCFGEIDPAPTCPQSFSVVASTPMRVLTFSAFGISRLCGAIPDARDRILDALPSNADTDTDAEADSDARNASATGNPRSPVELLSQLIPLGAGA